MPPETFPDTYLQGLLMNAAGYEKITGYEKRSYHAVLSLGGTIVTGKLISQRRYHELLLGRPLLEMQCDGLPDVAPWVLADLDHENGEAEFIHLSGAQFPGFWPETFPPEGVLWRCRVDRVDGYSVEQRDEPPAESEQAPPDFFTPGPS